jgi:hypothetical protein
LDPGDALLLVEFLEHPRWVLISTIIIFFCFKFNLTNTREERTGGREGTSGSGYVASAGTKTILTNMSIRHSVIL